MKAHEIQKLQDLLTDPSLDDSHTTGILQRMLKMLDQITREQSAFSKFEELVKARGNYTPSIDVSDRFPGYQDRMALANAYDAHMMTKGDDRRAYRYGAKVDNQAFKGYRKSIRENRA